MMTGAGDSLWSISAVDGRYQKDLQELSAFVSEGALMKYRIQVEAAWLLFLNNLSELKTQIVLSPKVTENLETLARGAITPAIIAATKEHEKTTNHDVKAVEYVIRDILIKAGAQPAQLAWIHFACTSEDINNLSYALMLKEVRAGVLLPLLDELIGGISGLAKQHAGLAMLSRTHGQTATPTTLGKEMAVFVRRLQRQRARLVRQPIEGKINGAVGNFNAHVAALPSIDWIAASRSFVEGRLQLEWNPLTTQIETHDTFVEFAEILKLTNMILLDFCRDMWGYISHHYFAQKAVSGEVGSSTMPHKVNPIYFENAEGNIGVANALLGHFGDKLPVSRFQRDLSDSTVLRVTGTAIGHTVLAWKSTLKGLARVAVNQTAISKDLDQAWEVLGEAVQTVMRRYGVSDAYERLKAATRGQGIVTKAMIAEAIGQCSELPAAERQKLLELSPAAYTGLASQLVAEFLAPPGQPKENE